MPSLLVVNCLITALVAQSASTRVTWIVISLVATLLLVHELSIYMPPYRRADRTGEWWVDFRYSGRRIRRKSPVQTKTGAIAFERVLRQRLLELEASSISPLRESETIFSNFVERWMRDYVKPWNRPTSIQTKEGIFRNYLLPAFGPLHLRAITAERVDILIRTLVTRGLSPKTINNTTSVLRTCLTSAVRWNLLASVPDIAALKVPEYGYKFLSGDEMRRLVAAAKPGYWRTLIIFLVHTGCRFGEAAALRWEDLELEGLSPRVRIERSASLGHIGPTKSGRVRDIPLTRDVVQALSSMPRTNDFVFVRPHGELPKPSSVQRYLHATCDRAGIRRISWHVLRHSFATELSARRVPLRTIQDLLGHANISMTCRYAHVAEKSMREAVEELPYLVSATT